MIDKLRKWWNKIRRHINKYQLVLAVFLILIFFADDHNVFKRIKYQQSINSLKKEIRIYENEITKNKQKLTNLQTNDKDLEKFAREEYLMKKNNEDIFILNEK